MKENEIGQENKSTYLKPIDELTAFSGLKIMDAIKAGSYC